ncbi:unnamed protein product [Hanseniaspora opuntiae]
MLNRNIIKKQLSAKRFLNIHEFRAQNLMKSYDIPVPKGYLVEDAKDSLKLAEQLFKENSSLEKLVLKSQVLSGGRGKGHFKDSPLKSGIQFITKDDLPKVNQIASDMINKTLVTKQTGAEGKKVSYVYLTECLKGIEQESYLSMMLDRNSQKILIVASDQGGMNIEEVAEKTPEKIHKYFLEISTKTLDSAKALEISKNLGFKGEANIKEGAKAIQNLFKIFQEKDTSLIEINPIAQLATGEIKCVDAKFSFDDAAEFRQKELHGNIATLVNGAGLAMATMDTLKLYGGTPANFLDCGGTATPETIETAFKLILKNPDVKTIFVNIFGGIVRCDYVAEGLINASKNLNISIPIVVRLKGTNVDIGKKLLNDSGMNFHFIEEFDKAAEKAVSFTK